MKIFERALNIEISLEIQMIFISFVNLRVTQKSKQVNLYL